MVSTTMVAVVTNQIGLQRSRLPQPRRESAEVVAIGHPRQASEDVLHIGQRVFAVTLARDNQRVEDGGAFAGIGVPDKQPVLFSDARGPDRVFDQLIVEATFAVMQMGAERCPLAEQVIAGFAERRLRQYTLPRPQGEALQTDQGAAEALGLGPSLGPLGRAQLLFVPNSLPQIHAADQAQRRLRHPGIFLLGLEEPAPGVRPAAEPNDRRVRTRIRTVVG